MMKARLGDAYDLHAKYMNPQMVKVLRSIGFDKTYVRGEGQYLFDDKGNRYLDFVGGHGVFNIGRNHPKVRKAIEDALAAQTANLVQFDCPILAGMAAEALVKKCPEGLNRVFFCSGGSEAVETALKMARGATGKPRIISTLRGFHGDTYGSLSLNGNPEFKDGFGPFLPGAEQIPFDDLGALERALAPGDVAAFVVEPIQGKGVYPASPNYLSEALRLCKRYGALLVADEVQVGLGRTGRFFAFEHYNVVPDIVCLAKSLGGGYIPCGAAVMRADIFDKVFSSMDRCVVHGFTFSGNDLAMAAVIATLQVLDEEKIIENAAARGKELMDGLNALKPKYEMLADIRGKGLIIGVEFGPPKSLALRAGWSLMHSVDEGLFGVAIVMPLLEKHRILAQVAGHQADIVKLLPTLAITAEDVRYFLGAFEEILKECHKFPGPIWEVGGRLAKLALTARMGAKKKE